LPLDGYHVFARWTAVATFILILAGALVTSTRSGLAVPDWPLSFGTLFPEMVGGVRFEHTHRLIAGGVALLTMVLGIWVIRAEERRSVRILAGAAMGAVLVQALLGGLTVLLKLPPAVSASHGTLAQTFFCMIVALAMVTSPAWRDARPVPMDAAARWLRVLAPLTTVLVWLQLVVAASMRHLKAGLAFVDFPLYDGQVFPDFSNLSTSVLNAALNFTHRSLGWLILLLTIACVSALWLHFRRACANVSDNDFSVMPSMLGAGLRLGALVVVQILLGAATVWLHAAPVPTSLHVVNGALVLVTSLVLTLWTRRAFMEERAS